MIDEKQKPNVHDVLVDLLIQATTEHSHYYVANCIRMAMDEINTLTARLTIATEALEFLRDNRIHDSRVTGICIEALKAIKGEL